jgi:NitT/TauT family transport system substrate-binding protein
MTRRSALSFGAAAGLTMLRPGLARAADTIRIALPTKTFWPTIVAETAKRRKLFDKEGIGAELTVYRGGAEAFEAVAAGAADLVLDSPALAATAVSRGIASKVVAAGEYYYLGWQLMVKPDSPVTDVTQLAGKKVGITSAGSGSDLLALWTMQEKKIHFTRVPVGGGGLVPNLRAGNVDAVVLYSPLVFQELQEKRARTIIDYATAVPENLNGAWIAPDKLITNNPALVQKSLNALFGGLAFLRQNRDQALKLISEIDEITPEIAVYEYEQTTLKLSADGLIEMGALRYGLELAKLSGMTNMAPAEQIVTQAFKPVPTT